ncbi:MAG: PAS domain S-box protein, partial [Candidatus Scalindua sp.]
MCKIRNKILVIFLSVIIIPIAIISVFFTLHTTKNLKQDKINDFKQSTNVKVEKAKLFVRSIEVDIKSLANNVLLLRLMDAVAREDVEQINQCKFNLELFFEAFSESKGIYDQICYIDEAGHEVIRVDLLYRDYADIVPPEELQDKSNRYYFKEAVKLSEGEIYVSKLDLNRERGEIESPHKPMLRYAMPVFDGEKRKRGVLVLNVLADYLLKDILTHRFLKGIDSYLLDKGGFYLRHPEISKQWGGPDNLNTGENIKNDLPQEIVSLILSGQSGNKLADELFFNFKPIHFDTLNKERYWIFMEGFSKSIIYSQIYSFYKVFGLLVSLLIAGVVTAALIFSKKLTRPLSELVKGANAVAKGNLDCRMAVSSNDEIALLTSSFNAMTFRLGESRKQLQYYTHNLEQKVEDKTKEITREKEHTEKLLETAQDAIIGIYENGMVSIWNKSAEKIFGYSKGEITGRPVTAIIPERYREQHENGVRRFLETGEARIMDKTVEVHGITKEGIEVPIEMSLAFQKGKDGHYSFMAIIRDITERKMREGEIQKLTYAIEQSPVSVVITDTEGNIEYVNKKFTQVTGYSYEEVIGKNPRVLKSDDRTSEEYSELWETITSGKEWRGEFCNKDKNGEKYWESASISPVKNYAGVITHFIAVKEDITDRRQIEENLRKLSQAVEQSPSSVMITDTEGKIEYINPKFTELTGYTPEDTLGQTPRILKSGKTPLEEYKKLWKDIKSDREWQGEFCNKKKNGILYWEHTSISPVKNEKGNT